MLLKSYTDLQMATTPACTSTKFSMLHVSVESEVRDYIIIKKIEDIFMDLILSIDLAGFLNH